MGARANQKHRVIRLRDVLRRTGLSRSGAYRLRRLGEFPKALKLGVRAVGFLESDVNEWIAERAKDSHQ